MKILGIKKLDDKRINPLTRKFVLFVIDSLNKNKDFDNLTLVIVEVMRELERQKSLIKSGASQTLKSKHLIGKAVDLVFSEKGIALWNRKDLYKILYGLFLVFLKKEGIKGTWGGDWNKNGLSSDERFLDSPHFQIDN